MLNWDDEITAVEELAVRKVLRIQSNALLERMEQFRRSIVQQLAGMRRISATLQWVTPAGRKARLLAYKIYLRRLAQARSQERGHLEDGCISPVSGWRSTRSEAANSRQLAPVAAPPFIA